jgi:hypothetical protein
MGSPNGTESILASVQTETRTHLARALGDTNNP